MEPGLLEAFRPCPRRFPDPAPHPQGERALLSRRDPLERSGAGRAAPRGRGLMPRRSGECRPNRLEFKLVDSTGSNVWWCNRRDFEFPRAWETVATKRRQIQFAWGPAGGGEIRHVAALELAVTAGSGGAGTVWLDDL